jgi:hypothetical protein
MKSTQFFLGLSFLLIMASCASESAADRSKREANELTDELLDELETASDTLPPETADSIFSEGAEEAHDLEKMPT